MDTAKMEYRIKFISSNKDFTENRKENTYSSLIQKHANKYASLDMPSPHFLSPCTIETLEKPHKIPSKDPNSIPKELHHKVISSQISSLFDSHKRIMDELLTDNRAQPSADFKQHLEELSIQNSRLLLENIALKKKLVKHHN